MDKPSDDKGSPTLVDIGSPTLVDIEPPTLVDKGPPTLVDIEPPTLVDIGPPTLVDKKSTISQYDPGGSTYLRMGLVFGAVAIVLGVLAYRLATQAPKLVPPAGTWSGKVARVWRAGGGSDGLEVCTAEGKGCRSGTVDLQIAERTQLRTDELTQASVQFGQDVELLLDRNTYVSVSTANHRELRIVRGNAVVTASGISSALQVQVPGGTLDMGPSKVAITADAKSSVIDVAHGVLRVVDDQKREAKVHAGEQIRIVDGRIRTTAGNATLGEGLLWSEVASRTDRTDSSRGLGELKAKKPGANDELKGAVHLAAHKVQVRIVSSLVRTEIEETFDNGSNDVLEGIYRFPLPSDAKIERLALDVDGKMQDGSFVDRDRAAAIWRGAIVNATPVEQRVVKDDIVWVPGPWRDPALLEWQRGGRFELRVFPIPRRGSRRVVIAYTQISNPSGDLRRYVYPLAYDPSATTKIGQFDLDIQVRGHDVEQGVRSIGYTLRQSTDTGVTRLSTSERDFTPHGDITLEYALPHAQAELKAWAYSASREPLAAKRGATTGPEPPAAKSGATTNPQQIATSSAYAALALRPSWPGHDSDAARDVVVVVDASRSMLGENLQRAKRLALRLLTELEPADRGAVLACDAACQVLPEGMTMAGGELTDAANRFLSSVRAEGASDPTAAIRAAVVLADRGREGRPLSIVYVGDGTPTVGPIRPGTVEKSIEHDLGDSAATVMAVGVGSDSDSETLSALARGGGGATVNFLPGKSCDEIAYNVIGAIRGTHLRNVRVELPEGLVDVAPRRPDSLRSGSELWVQARMLKPVVRGDVVLRGRLGKEPFERRWPVELVATDNEGNAFVPRLFAAARIADLEREGDAQAKREVVELSQLHHVASRYTSLLVLESEAMLKAFHLVKTEPTPAWSGESDDEQQIALDENKGEPATAESSAPVRTQVTAAQPKKAAVSDPDLAAPAAAPARAAAPGPANLLQGMAEKARSSGAALESPADIASEEFPPPRVMIPMRRIWERKGSFSSERVPHDAGMRLLAQAEDAHFQEPERRSALKSLLALYRRRSELDHADSLVELWNNKEPLDADALTARADSAASRGRRSDAIRLLGSVIDVRPDDVKAQQRLARLYRWSGDREQSCRFWVALSEFHSDKAEWLVEAVRCSRGSDNDWLADYLMNNAADAVRQQAERLLAQTKESVDALSGDLRIDADWSGSSDIDIALITPDGQRVSWLGAPTRQVISARDVTSQDREGLALRAAPAGNYVIELVRVSGTGTVHGNLSLTIANLRKTVPFTLRDYRTVAGIATLTSVPKLIPIYQAIE